ncbi:hypothetical protein OIO90_006383 [Microbotryomycetes sp. JL221]|nr:hypothetical protein OIO90_006383 [Microbotryomycetes sp. JL221]
MMLVDERDFGVVRGKAARLLGEEVLPVPGGKAAALLGFEPQISSPHTSPKLIRVAHYKHAIDDTLDSSDDEYGDEEDDEDDETLDETDDDDGATIQDSDSISCLPPPSPSPSRSIRSPLGHNAQMQSSETQYHTIRGSLPRLSISPPPPPHSVGLGFVAQPPGAVDIRHRKDHAHREQHCQQGHHSGHCRYESGWTVDSNDFTTFVLPKDFYKTSSVTNNQDQMLHNDNQSVSDSCYEGQKSFNQRSVSPSSPRLSVFSNVDSLSTTTRDSSDVGHVMLTMSTPESSPRVLSKVLPLPKAGSSFATAALPPTPPTRPASPATSLIRRDTSRSTTPSLRTRSAQRSEALLALEGNRTVLTSSLSSPPPPPPLILGQAKFKNSSSDHSTLSPFMTPSSQRRLKVYRRSSLSHQKTISIKTPSPTKSVWSDYATDNQETSFLSYSSDSDSSVDDQDNESRRGRISDLRTRGIESSPNPSQVSSFRTMSPRDDVPKQLFTSSSTEINQNESSSTRYDSEDDDEPGSPMDPISLSGFNVFETITRSKSRLNSRRPTETSLNLTVHAPQEHEQPCLWPSSNSIQSKTISNLSTIENQNDLVTLDEEETQLTKGLRLSLASWLVPSSNGSEYGMTRLKTNSRFTNQSFSTMIPIPLQEEINSIQIDQRRGSIISTISSIDSDVIQQDEQNKTDQDLVSCFPQPPSSSVGTISSSAC